jgi:hypothetical protein
MDTFDILVITQPSFKNDIKSLEEQFKIKIHVKCFDFITIFQAACARLFIFEYEQINQYEKILYLDSDIIIKADITPIFHLDIDDLLHGLECGTIGSPSFGSQFFDLSKISEATSGINSGTLLFKNSQKMRDLFSRIRKHVDEFTESGQKIPYCMDQPFINYHAIKDGLYDNKVLNQYISLYEGNDTVNNYETSSICHFSYPIGNFGHKYDRMKKFFDKILHTNTDNTPIPEIINKTYSWDNDKSAYIKFTGTDVETKWGRGKCIILNKYFIQVHWNNYFHLIKMDNDYKNYICVCVYPLDFVFHSGSVIENICICAPPSTHYLFNKLSVPHGFFTDSIETYNETESDNQKVFCLTYDITTSENIEEYFDLINCNITNYKAIIIVGDSLSSVVLKEYCIKYKYAYINKDTPWFIEEFIALYSGLTSTIPIYPSIYDKADIPSGEKFQQLANVYLGYFSDFSYNPLILRQLNKCLEISNIPSNWNNPPLIFCYSNRILELATKINSFNNNCVIIFGNSDENITYDKCKDFIKSSKIIHIYCQNLLFSHKKISVLPIGLANSQWAHGNTDFFLKLNKDNLSNIKDKYIFCSFKIETNSSKRRSCHLFAEKNMIENKKLSHETYLTELSKHKFSLCPEGNGVDTHRFWESVLVKTVPIMVRSVFTEFLHSTGLPCVLIDSWDTFTIDMIPEYSTFVFNNENNTLLSFKKISNSILYSVQLEEKLSIVYAYIGSLPLYTMDTVQQLRMFYDGPIYFITNDYNSPTLIKLIYLYNVTVIKYEDVIDLDFQKLLDKNYSKFHIADGLDLENRQKLFIYSFERFYVLHKFMKLFNINNVFFMELDNLVYDDPRKWLKLFSRSDFAYMIDNIDRGASGVAYIKNTVLLSKFLDHCNKYIDTALEKSERSTILNEMEALYSFFKTAEDDIQILPTHWPDKNLPSILYKTFNEYDSLFDAAALGIYFGGLHPYHTFGDVIKYVKNPMSVIDCTKYKYEWKCDEKNRRVPYVWYDDRWLRINNLHIHTKRLQEFMSFP